MIMKLNIKHIAIVLLLGAALQSCFKDVITYTDYRIAILNQTTSGGQTTPATLIDSYAYYVDTTDWAVLSYDDALAGRITNKTTGEVLSQPDVWGTFDSAAEFQTTIHLEQPISMLVVVDPDLRLYAYRKYELPENLDQVLTRLTLSSWRASHAVSGWQVENDFYTEEDEASADDITQN